MSDTTRLALPRIDSGQAQKHVTHNEALALLDALVHLSVIDVVFAPPEAPAEAARYLIGVDASGVFAGHGQAVAAYDDGAWRFLGPCKGWRAYIERDGRFLVFDGSAWTPLKADVSEVQNLRFAGVGGAADANNPFLARLNSALFMALRSWDGGSGDLRVKLDKQQSGGTASHIYSTNFVGRAETGLMGDDRFRIKVSPDGGTWKEALEVDPDTGRVFFPNGATDFTPNAATTSGTPAAYRLATPARGSLADGALFWMTPHAPNATALNIEPTLQLDRIDAAPLPLRAFDGTRLSQGALEAGRTVIVRKGADAYCVQTSGPVAFSNLLDDGGRFAGAPEPVGVTASTFADPGYLANVNGATRANYGLARAGSAMAAPVSDLLNKIRAPADQPGGVEFFVTQVTAGAGVNQGVSIQNTMFYPAFGSTRVLGRAATAGLYVRVMSGSLVLAPIDAASRVLVDGVMHNTAANTPDRVFGAAQGWIHVQTWAALAKGAPTYLWPTRVTPGSVFLIALPAVLPGFVTLPWDIGPVPSTRVWR